MSDRDGFLWLWSRLRARGVFAAITAVPWILVSFSLSMVLIVHSQDTMEPTPTATLLLGAPALAAIVASREGRRVYRRTEARYQALVRGGMIPPQRPRPFTASSYAGLKLDLRWWAAFFATCLVVPAGLFLLFFRI